MRLLILADSLGLPRKEPGNVVLWDKTWPAILRARLLEDKINCELINRSARASTILDLIDRFEEDVELTQGTLFIVQVGVVDCAPRIISPLMRKIFKLPGFPRKIKKTIIRDRSRKRQHITSKDPLKYVWTQPDVFAQKIETYLNQLILYARGNNMKTSIIVLPILGSIEQMDAKSPGFSENVSIYNQIIQDVTARHQEIILCAPEPNDIGIPRRLQSSSLYGPDGYHPNAKGNQVIAEMIFNVL